MCADLGHSSTSSLSPIRCELLSESQDLSDEILRLNNLLGIIRPLSEQVASLSVTTTILIEELQASGERVRAALDLLALQQEQIRSVTHAGTELIQLTANVATLEGRKSGLVDILRQLEVLDETINTNVETGR